MPYRYYPLLYDNTQAQVKEVKPHTVSPLNFSIQGEKEYNERFVKAEKLWERMYQNSEIYEDFTEGEQEILDNVRG
ncbi:MAG: hypothetical protein LBG19_01950 [Prevotellaceae bacterium]|nr:hypothetical protein [Prevotellaceae bacterium]